VHLRRALLLFAIVLGLSAIVASVSRTDRGKHGAGAGPADETQALPKQGLARPVRVTFSSSDRNRVRRVPVRQAVEVSVTARRAGLGAIGGLNVSGATEPNTAARFEVFQARPGSFQVSFTPAGTSDSKRLGTLLVVPR
jgi:hypothetical protein